jgi:hypothetical protein
VPTLPANPLHTSISAPVHTAAAFARSLGADWMLVLIQESLPGL